MKVNSYLIFIHLSKGVVSELCWWGVFYVQAVLCVLIDISIQFTIIYVYIFCSHYADVDPENQNFLLESNMGKKKYETEFVS